MNLRILATASALALAACTSTGGPSAQLQTAANDAALVVNGVAAEIKQVETLYPTALPAADMTKLNADLAAAQGALAQLATLASTPVTGTELQTIDQNINAVVGIAASDLDAFPVCAANPACAAVEDGLTAGAVLLPGIEAMANQLITGVATPTPAPATADLVPGGRMTPDQARLLLRGAAGK